MTSAAGRVSRPADPFEDFGGPGPLLHFAHANGYPPRAYTPLLTALAARCHVLAMAARPLWPAGPGLAPEALAGWSPLTRDLIRFLDEHGAAGLIGAGHSLGAISTLEAALDRPDLFRALVLIDPVIFRRRRLWAWQLVRGLGLADRAHPLIPGTLRRRRTFASTDEAYSRYRRAPVFRRMSDSGLRTCVEAMLRPRADGRVELAYSPEWEAAVYRQGPPNLWPRLARLQPPLLVIYGAESDTFQPAAARRLQRTLPQARLQAIAGAGHLVALEQPEAVAAAALEFLDDVLGPRP